MADESGTGGYAAHERNDPTKPGYDPYLIESAADDEPLDAEANTAAYAEYEARRAQIEQDFGETLSFEPLPDKKACRIAAYLPDADVTNTSKHVEYADWLMETHERFRAAIEAARNAIATERPVASGLS